MLKQILQTIGLCFVVLLLTTEVAFGDPGSSSIFLANHSPDHEIIVPVESGEPSVQADSDQPTQAKSAEQMNSEPSASESREREQAEVQANPSAPYDPYDYDAIREMNRQIYGEVKDQNS